MSQKKTIPIKNHDNKTNLLLDNRVIKRKSLKNSRTISSQTNRNRFEMVGVKLASPQKIREWSERKLHNGEIVGEIRKPDTMNYRTGRPEPDGLLCEKIFGPLKSWECGCGQYKFRPKTKPFYCPSCGVEVTESHVRRHRMGHVALNYPITHTWYLKGSPSYLSIILDQPLKDLETIVYLVEEEKTLEELENEARESVKRLLGPNIQIEDSKSEETEEIELDKWVSEWLKTSNAITQSLINDNENSLFLELNKEDLRNKLTNSKNLELPRVKKLLNRQKRPTTYQEWVDEEVNALLLAKHVSKKILNITAIQIVLKNHYLSMQCYLGAI